MEIVNRVKNWEELIKVVRNENFVLPVRDVVFKESENKEYSSAHLKVDKGEITLVLDSCEDREDIGVVDRGKQSNRGATKYIGAFDAVRCVLSEVGEITLNGVSRGDWSHTLGGEYTHLYRVQSISCCESQYDGGSIYASMLIPNTKLKYEDYSLEAETVSKLSEQPKWRSSGGGLVGEHGKFRYEVVQEADDLRIDISSKADSGDSCLEEIIEFSSNFLECFRWINGGNAYPYSTFFNDNRGRIFKSELRLTKEDKFESNLMPSHPLMAEKAKRVISDYLKYTQGQSELRQTFSNLFWQYREARVVGSIRMGQLLHLTTLVEGLSRVILRDVYSYSKNRLKRMSAKDRLREAAGLLEIKWQDIDEQVAIWKRVRNDLAHGDFESISNWEQFLILDAYRAANQIFNVMMLRLIGCPKGQCTLRGEGYAMVY